MSKNIQFPAPKKKMEFTFPAVGMRTLKTAFAAALCAFVYYFFDRSPTFACIGAIFGLGYDMESSKLHGGNRLFGTIIGGVLGMLLYGVYLQIHPEGEQSLLLVLFLFVGVILLILACQILWVGGVQPGGVVLCILLFELPADAYASYAINRILDTAVGVVVALLINRFFPRDRVEFYLSKLWVHSRKLQWIWRHWRPTEKQ